MKNVSITKVENTTIVSVTDRNGVKNYSYNKGINPVARNASNEILIEDPDRNNPPLFIPFSVIEDKLSATTPSGYLAAASALGFFSVTPEPLPYKIYVARLVQSGTNNPTVNVLENTLGTVNVLRYAQGTTELNSAGLFTNNKTVISIQNPRSVDAANGSFVIYDDEGFDASTIRFSSLNQADTSVDGYDTIVTIKVYN